MESVDKLWEWSKRYDNNWIDPKTGETTHIYGECQPHERFSVNEGERLREHLDEIEREHEREVTMARGEAATELGSKVAREYVKLPVDADGEPIHIGDYLHCDETGKDFPCRGYCCSVGKNGERRWTVECSYDAYSGTSEYVSARRCHHHHEPTVEDVLREFGKAWVEWEDCSPYDPIAKYADLIREVLRDE